MAFISSTAFSSNFISRSIIPNRNKCNTSALRMTASTELPTLHIETPLLESKAPYFKPDNDHGNHAPKVLLKMDNNQPGGSFKIRGHGHLLATHVASGKTRFISSSGGNAGMAVTIAASHLNVSATIVLPSTTPTFMQNRLQQAGANVIVHGDVWNEADTYAKNLVNEDLQSVYVSPFDDELLWDGHASLIREIEKQTNGEKPSSIVVSVGGGGLLLGVIHGLKQNGWIRDVTVIAAETEGADSFSQMVQNEKIVELEAITSIAKSLGALSVSKKCLELVQQGEADIQSVVVSDKEAVEACSALAVHHRVLVEPACGCAVAAAKKIMTQMPKAKKDGPIVVVVCGGSMTSPALLAQWISATGASEQQL